MLFWFSFFLTKLRQYNFYSLGDKITCFTDQNDPVLLKKFLVPAVQRNIGGPLAMLPFSPKTFILDCKIEILLRLFLGNHLQKKIIFFSVIELTSQFVI